MTTMGVLAIVGLAIQYFLLSTIIFKVYEMSGSEKANKAYVPIYRYYMLFKFYKGRAYKRDYSKLFLLIIVVAWGLNFINKLYNNRLESVEELMKSNDAAMNLVAMYGNKILLLTAFLSLLSLIIELGALLPLVKELWIKLIIILVNVVSLILTQWTSFEFLKQYREVKGFDHHKIYEIKESLVLPTYVGGIVYFILTIFLLYICQSYYKKFLNGEDVIVSLEKDNDNIFKERNYSIYR